MHIISTALSGLHLKAWRCGRQQRSFVIGLLDNTWVPERPKSGDRLTMKRPLNNLLVLGSAVVTACCGDFCFAALMSPLRLSLHSVTYTHSLSLSV